jgi:hypothetical protein
MIDINEVDDYIDPVEYEEIFPEEQSYQLWIAALEADFFRELKSIKEEAK